MAKSKQISPQRIEDAASTLAPKWSVALILHLMDNQPCGYAQLQQAIPNIPEPSLSVRLRALENAGIIVRRAVPTRPITVRYSLTAQGERLRPVFEAMDDWLRGLRR